MQKRKNSKFISFQTETRYASAACRRYERFAPEPLTPEKIRDVDFYDFGFQ